MVAVLLQGCGAKDGGEITETVSTLIALEKERQNKNQSFAIELLAPNYDQRDVINHLTGEIQIGEKRNLLVEAARIARGKIQDLEQVDPLKYDALVIPGGFGVAKNLCDFAVKGSLATVRPIIAEFIQSIHKNKKPIGAICISPVLLALLINKVDLSITLGPISENCQEIEKLGMKCPVTGPTEFIYDEKYNIYTTSAYMNSKATSYEVYCGIEKMINALISKL